MQNSVNSYGKKESHFEGVYQAFRKNGEPYYRASLTWKGKHISLGSFSSAIEAHAAYIEGKHIVKDTSCTPDNYPDSCLISYEKWISLINFRDNNIYLGNPIYVGRKLFYYYLSPVKVLKFDLDDLFYFSSHKIMRRGNHYFVADYGLQVSIITRYNIKPYAREGVDYQFINGDNTDFRRENIRILNVYHGVTKEQKKGQIYYTVRIHIKGNYIVGRYPNETEAAIAYNKAADILHKKGLNKAFQVNYIEGLSSARYAEIYSGLTISPKILHWKKKDL